MDTTNPAYRAALDQSMAYASGKVDKKASQFDSVDEAEAVHHLTLQLIRSTTSRNEMASLVALLAVQRRRRDQTSNGRTAAADGD
jgi:hypothetical protein